MEIILLESVKGLGNRFDTVTVKPGYGRNFLIPKKLAITSNRTNKALMNEELRKVQHQENKLLSQVTDVFAKLSNANIKIQAVSGANNKIFGSVTNLQLANAIKEQVGLNIDRRHIHIIDEVKTLGSYKAEISFKNDQKSEFSFEVTAK